MSNPLERLFREILREPEVLAIIKDPDSSDTVEGIDITITRDEWGYRLSQRIVGAEGFDNVFLTERMAEELANKLAVIVAEAQKERSPSQ